MPTVNPPPTENDVSSEMAGASRHGGHIQPPYVAGHPPPCAHSLPMSTAASDRALDDLVAGHLVRSGRQPSHGALHHHHRMPTPKVIGAALTGESSSPAAVGRQRSHPPLHMEGSNGGRGAHEEEHSESRTPGHHVYFGVHSCGAASREHSGGRLSRQTSGGGQAQSGAGPHPTPLLRQPSAGHTAPLSRQSSGAPTTGAPTVSRQHSLETERAMAAALTADRAVAAAGVAATAAAVASAHEPSHDRTYEDQQQEIAIRKVLALRGHEPGALNIFDRMERVRRGHCASRTAPNYASSTASAGEDSSKDAATATGVAVTAQLSASMVADAESDAKSPASSAADGPPSVRRMHTPYHDETVESRKHPTGPFEQAANKLESFQFEEEESLLHFEHREARRSREQLQLWSLSTALAVCVGALLGCISSSITLTEVRIWSGKQQHINEAMWPCGSECVEGAEPNVGAAFAEYLGFNCALTLAAALLVYWAPRATGSGLPQVKAYLNGVRVPGLLTLKTLVAKVVGITFIVSTGLPLGREGPMVHTGAIVGAILTRLRVEPMKRFSELRLPSKQRIWIGMGAAAGVAAAFNAPLGGILYAFEEVTSYWNANLTWKAFMCVVVAALIFNSLIDAASNSEHGVLLTEGFVLGNFEVFSANYSFGDIGWLALLGVGGGVVGAMYTAIVLRMTTLRLKLLSHLPKAKVLEAVCWAAFAFTIFFLTPLGFPCHACSDGGMEGGECVGIGDSSDSGASSTSVEYAGGRGRRLAGGGGGLEYQRHNCPSKHYNELATLLLSPQEGLIKHLLERETATEDHVLSLAAIGAFLAIYYVVAVLVFGISVPAGNFIPAMTIGAALGRLIGGALDEGEYHEDVADQKAGRYALMGAGAVLCGVSRMTITLAAILVEVTKDVRSIIPLMWTLAFAKISADLFAPGFDDGMIHIMHLPFLEHDPPHEFEVLTARDVMAREVVVLKEVEQVGDILAVLKRTAHCGFPIIDVGRSHQCSYFCGLILRRHLIVLLKHRVWKCDSISAELRADFFESGLNARALEQMLNALDIPPEDFPKVIDLRTFMDPCPYLANELMPLRRVYRLFNELGVRHLPVVDCHEQVVGMITRKDVQPEIIEERFMQQDPDELTHMMTQPLPDAEAECSSSCASEPVCRGSDLKRDSLKDLSWAAPFLVDSRIGKTASSALRTCSKLLPSLPSNQTGANEPEVETDELKSAPASPGPPQRPATLAPLPSLENVRRKQARVTVRRRRSEQGEEESYGVRLARSSLPRRARGCSRSAPTSPVGYRAAVEREEGAKMRLPAGSPISSCADDRGLTTTAPLAVEPNATGL